MTLDLRRLDRSDLRRCLDLAVERSWAPERVKWGLLFDVGEVYGIDAPDGTLAATAVATRYGTTTAISMVLTATGYERQGLATRLMRHTMALAPSSFLTATAYGRPLYERLGFRTVGGITSFTCDELPPPSPSATRPATEADLPAVIAEDTAVFGAPRDALITALFPLCQSFRVAPGAFGGAWRNHEQTVIGPVTAPDTPTAMALITALAADTPAPYRLDVDHRQPALLSWARTHLTPVFSVAAMEHGPPLPADPARTFAPVSVALG